MSALGDPPDALTGPKTGPGMPGKGDAMLVCRADGSTSLLLIDTDRTALLRKLSVEGELSAEEHGHLDAATRAMTLWFASQSAPIMEALTAAINESGVLGGAEFPNLN